MPHRTWLLAKPIELYSQLTSLRPDIFPKLSEYGQRYCSGGRFGAFSGSSESQELFAVVSSSVMIRRKKKDVLTQLPPETTRTNFLGDTESREKFKNTTDRYGHERVTRDGNIRAENVDEQILFAHGRGESENGTKYLENLLESVEEEKEDFVLGASQVFVTCRRRDYGED